MKALPKHLNDIEATELIWGPPERILSYSDFRPYQCWMAEQTKKVRRVYLAAEMGLGKTGASLKAVSDLLRDQKIRSVLVVAPMHVAENTWPEQIATWDFARHLTFKVVTGTSAQRLAALDLGHTDLTIINRENLFWLYGIYGPHRWPFDAVIYDEATRLKGGTMKTKARMVNGVRKKTGRKTDLGVLDAVRHKVQYLILLSGTPAPKGLIDLWGPVYAIDAGKRLGVSKTSFIKRWFHQNLYSYGVEPMEHSKDEIMSRINDVFFSLREQDYLSLPPLHIIDRKVHLPDSVYDEYRKFEKEAAIEVLQGDREEVVRALNGGILTNKLLQFANGSLYTEDKGIVRLHSAKLDALESIVQESGGKPILVAYSYQFDRDAILKKFPSARAFGSTPNDLRDWNAGKIQMLVLHPASAGHGLNFQKGSNIAVWYGLNWSLELYQQLIKRLHRSGQLSDRVLVYRILAHGTVDEDVANALKMKNVEQNAITDAVRVRLQKALAS